MATPRWQLSSSREAQIRGTHHRLDGFLIILIIHSAVPPSTLILARVLHHGHALCHCSQTLIHVRHVDADSTFMYGMCSQPTAQLVCIELCDAALARFNHRHRGRSRSHRKVLVHCTLGTGQLASCIRDIAYTSTAGLDGSRRRQTVHAAG
jgi:hypothetical protein